MKLACGELCSVGTAVFAIAHSSRGQYACGDVGVVTYLNKAGPVVRWENTQQEAQASFKRLQVVPTPFVALADGRPARPGLRVVATRDIAGITKKKKKNTKKQQQQRKKQSAGEWQNSPLHG